MDKKIVIIGFLIVAIAIAYIIYQLNKEKRLWESQIKLNDAVIKNLGIPLSEIADEGDAKSVLVSLKERLNQKTDTDEEIQREPVDDATDELNTNSTDTSTTEPEIRTKRKYTKKIVAEVKQKEVKKKEIEVENNEEPNIDVELTVVDSGDSDTTDNSGESNDNRLSGE